MIENESVPSVVAVVLTWNDIEMTSRCLSSVLDNDYSNLHVIVVDNGSVPQRGPELHRRFPEVEVVQLEENLGFSGGANRGIQWALERNPDYIHLIGNDATLAQDSISKLVEACEHRSDVGAASPVLLDPYSPGEEPVIQFYTATLNRDTARHIHHSVGKPYRKGEWSTVESEFIPCVALFFRAEALRNVGLLDESFGTCWEDFDLCIRFKDAGWKYLTVGDATATHIGSYTTGRISPYIVYYSTRNRLICIDRYSSRGAWWRHDFELIRSFWFQIKSHGITNWACHRAFIKGVIDYLFAIRGERGEKNKRQIPGLGAG